MGHTPQLPRRPDNPENVRRLREDAERRIAREELSTSPGYSKMGNVPENLPRPAYGGPPVTYRRNLARLMIAGFAVLSAGCRSVKRRRDPAPAANQPAPPIPAYGGPPVARPVPDPVPKPLRK
jgi:hypothetical protein